MRNYFLDPITPPPELVEQWRNLPEYTDGRQKMIMVTLSREKLQDIATKAANWGADQELEACCEWLHWQNLATHQDLIPSLRAARRPKPPSLKELALEALDEEHADMQIQNYKLIRSVLESLPD
jgi:hypothetical protein